MKRQFEIFGSSLGSMVLAKKLADNGACVRFWRASYLGSGWGGLHVGGVPLDTGQRYFELDYENCKQRSISTFDSATSSVRDYVYLVKNFIVDELNLPIQEVRVESYFRGRVIRCPLETVDLKEFVKTLEPHEARQIERELGILNNNARTELGMANNNYAYSSELLAHDYQTLLEANHGSTFNELLIFPFCRKIHLNLNEVPGRLRRKVWGPLFFGSTIMDWLHERSSFVPYRPHYSITDRSSCHVVSELERSLANNVNVTLVALDNVAVDGDTYVVNNEYSLCINDVINGFSFSAVARLHGIPLELSSSYLRIVWLKTDIDNLNLYFDYLSVIDRRSPITRLSSSSKSDNPKEFFICIEIADRDRDLKDILISFNELNLVKDPSKLVLIEDKIMKAYESPTFTNERNYADSFARFSEAYPNARLMPGQGLFGRNSFTEQVLSALKMYEILRESI